MDRRSSDGVQPEWAAGFRKNYMNRLVHVLRRIRERRRIEDTAGRCRAVKFAADLTLAVTARGHTWSRSILAQSRKNSPDFRDFIGACAGRKSFYNKPKPVSGHRLGGSRRCKASDQWRINFHRIRRNLLSVRRGSSKCRGSSFKRSKLNASSKKSARRLLGAIKRREEIRTVDARIQTLRGLVPGGRCMDTPLLLQEVADYIVALRMQVETMQILAKYSSNSGATDSRR